MDSAAVKQIARECGFELCGITSAQPVPDYARFEQWLANGYAADMHYLADHRAEKRRSPDHLLPDARSVICAARVYNTPQPYSTEFDASGRAWISRYAWGDDYHDLLRSGLQRVVDRMLAAAPFNYKICVDTAPLLERSLARQAGLGWIGRNTCLINQSLGSWIFLGEVIVSLDLEPDAPPPDRCGTCRRCIDACPTDAIVPEGDGWALDSRLCISYLTIEARDVADARLRGGIGNHVFGCDICQDVCPWNRRQTFASGSGFEARGFAPPLEELADVSEDQFRQMFRSSPVSRARYAGFLRNVAIAMGNDGAPRFREPLDRLSASNWPQVAAAASWAIQQLESGLQCGTWS